MKRAMNRKGEGMTSSQIIGLVLLVAGFLILLGLLAWVFLINNSTDDDACKLSVLTRATTPFDATKGLIPLKCVTSKICVTESAGETCSQFLGEKDIKYEVLKGTKEEKKEMVEKIAADAMYACWDMTGQGKLDLFGSLLESTGFAEIKSTCIICSRIAISDEIYKKAYAPDANSEERYILDNSNINEYMRTHQVPGSGKTYLETFTNKGASSYAKADESSLKSYSVLDESNKPIGYSEIVGTQVPPKELTFVFMQIKSKTAKEVLTNMAKAGGTVAAGAFQMPVVGAIGKRLLMTPVGGTLALVGIGAAVGYGAYNAKQGQLAAAGYCGEFTSASTGEKGKGSEGCSMVQGLEYDYRAINALCGRVEGSP